VFVAQKYIRLNYDTQLKANLSLHYVSHSVTAQVYSRDCGSMVNMTGNTGATSAKK